MNKDSALAFGRTALLGATGFVGGNLVRQFDFSEKYNSQNIANIAGERFGLVVFSAAKAEKWRINQNPEADLAHIDDLKRILGTFSADRIVLISTVDVYGRPVGVDETTATPDPGLHPYGLHRLELEQFVAQRFGNVSIIRLPGLFGVGIKKNIIFDFLTRNNMQNIDHRGLFQYYDLRRIWEDMQTALLSGLPVINFATEPVQTGRLVRECFGEAFTNELPDVTPGRYDVKSLHSSLFGSETGYLYSAEQVLSDLQSFVAQYGVKQ